MNRAQRKAHGRLWHVVSLAMVATFVLALGAKQRIEAARVAAHAGQGAR